MRPATPNQSDEKRSDQSEKFKRAARELGADESEERFEATLRKIAKAPAPKDEARERRKKDE